MPACPRLLARACPRACPCPSVPVRACPRLPDPCGAARGRTVDVGRSTLETITIPEGGSTNVYPEMARRCGMPACRACPRVSPCLPAPVRDGPHPSATARTRPRPPALSATARAVRDRPHPSATVRARPRPPAPVRDRPRPSAPA
ncbi:hypothetical protein GCM10007977_013860 [Dactylosporangium sucinum]|uniref:Uncharacterized protein n=1 Tax=Dactylosporangium sucinum TaxID=1424081 RepID=A0A917WMB9_9ACTN|nr:hypothetical protein GCM10007977_013860 [Dactylosporangium sucinum]